MEMPANRQYNLITEDAGKNYLSPHTSSWDEKYKDIGNEPKNGKAANIREPLTIPKEFWKYAVFIYLALMIISYIIAWNTGIDAFYIAPIILSLLLLCNLHKYTCRVHNHSRENCSFVGAEFIAVQGVLTLTADMIDAALCLAEIIAEVLSCHKGLCKHADILGTEDIFCSFFYVLCR